MLDPSYPYYLANRPLTPNRDLAVTDKYTGEVAMRVALLEATLLEDVPRDEAICDQEAFGPVAVLSRFRDFEEALREVNASAYGLQAGLFTRDLSKVQRASEALEVGGVVVGDVPSWRADQMPYGGVKRSGLGREGIRFAMEEMTEIRMLVIRTP